MIDDLSGALDHDFQDWDLLEEALTHRSAASRDSAAYERLEFLGDRVLALVVADMLMGAFPDEAEGDLARRLAVLVSQDTLAAVARDIGLGAHIRLSRGDADSGGRENDSILSDVCEAVIAAIYRDGGLGPARGFIRRYWQARLEAAAAPPQDPKTSLQQWALGRSLPLPEYAVVGREGPDHAPEFTISVTVKGHPAAEGVGPSKRSAEREAARRLLSDLGR